jgi:hypothetical protein
MSKSFAGTVSKMNEIPFETGDIECQYFKKWATRDVER